MDPTRFDDLTKALATSTSRRQALRRIGGILGGTALAGLFPGLARADNSACAHFCEAVFGENTPAEEQCAADAAHHMGLCYTCGPASPDGTQPICCPENPDGTCTSYSSATCCSGGQVCQKGTCVTPCLGLQQPCTSSSQCCDTGQGKTFCNVIVNPGFTVGCCNRPGGSCISNADCCFGGCAGGTCVSMSSGEPCFFDSDCFSGEMCIGANPPGTFGHCS